MEEKETIEVIEFEDVEPGIERKGLSPTQWALIAGTAVLGTGIGATVMYYTDPRLGKRRQALVRDQWVHFKKIAARGVRVGAKVMKDTLKGAGAEIYGALRPERYLPDEKLNQRIRSEVGRSLRHPHQFQIGVKDGVVTLLSAASDENFDIVIRQIQTVKGVKKVDFLPLT